MRVKYGRSFTRKPATTAADKAQPSRPPGHGRREVMMSSFMLVMTTVPDEQKGHQIARRLVEERLAACVTVSSVCRSFYWWEEKICEDGEYMLFIKTKSELYAALEKKVRELHPYTVPEVLGFSVSQGSEAYLDWLAKETLQR